MNIATRLPLSMLILACVAPVGWSATNEPVYLEFLRRSNPVAHFRLGSLDAAGLSDVLHAPTGAVAACGRVVAMGSGKVDVAPGPSPREATVGAALNGFEDHNTSLRFRQVHPASNAVVVLPGRLLPDFAEPHADELTVSIWVRTHTSQDNRSGLVSRKAGDGKDTFQFALALWSDRFDIIMSQANGTNRSIHTDITPDRNWQHLVFVMDSKGRYEGDAGAMRAYVNGRLVKTERTGNLSRTQLCPSQADIVIGGIAYGQTDDKGFSRCLDGCIDELTFWDRALSDAEVAELFQAAVIGRRPMVIVVGEAGRPAPARRDPS